MDRVREVSLDGRGSYDLVRVELRHRKHQRLRVRMQRLLEQLAGRRFLDHLAEVHDDDTPAHMTDDTEVVRDEEIGQVELLLQLDEEVQHLGLDRDVESRHGLVGDDELRADGECARDADALTLSAAELARPAVRERGREADPLEQLVHPRPPRIPRADPVHREHLLDRPAHRLARDSATRTDPER